MLNHHYDFYILTPKDGKALEEVMKGSVKWDLRGMVYRISQTGEQLLLAFEKPWDDSDCRDYTYYNIRIQEDKVMYTERIKPLFDEQHCELSKNPDDLFKFID